ncbi:hypothetical protein EBZ37_07720 [bacterium]|nr:hypothetical protein [bacterium]
MDDFFSKPERKHVRELNLVPVIDMFTTVIFFLILSTSFYGFTKLTLPPSKVSVNTDPLTPPPLSTKLLIGKNDGGFRLALSWVGSSPGQLEEVATVANIEDRVRGLAEKFTSSHPSEKTIQLGMTAEVDYQSLIRAMDGVREKLPDIVLISPAEASVRLGSAK